MSLVAITRKVSPSIADCELTHLVRQPIDLAAAQRQHAQYEAALQSLGCELHSLPAEPALPDSVFVEDAAVVFPELAVITRPGAASRRSETGAIATALARFRRLEFVTAPATLDGGDVLCLGKRVFVGSTPRSNAAAVEQLRAMLAPHGYTVDALAVTGCLHLKSAVTPVSEEAVLLNPRWVAPDAFSRYHLIEVSPDEPFGANALMVNRSVIFNEAHVRTRAFLQQRGIHVIAVDAAELAKAEGGVTCCSLIFESTSGV